eukprot:3948946-Pleurochrysis_carterae.AAC.1
MEDPPTGTRKLSRGLRAHHLRRLAREVDWRDTPGRRMQWAAALVALRSRSDGESGQDGQESAMGTPVAPTASENAGLSLHPCLCLCPLRHAPFPCGPVAAEAVDQALVGTAGA